MVFLWHLSDPIESAASHIGSDLTLMPAEKNSYPMPSRVTAALFSEPSGRRHATVMFGAALAFAALYGYAVRVAGSSGAGWLPFMIAGTALSGVAESLPDDRRIVAGVLRVTAIGVLASLIVAVAVVPELVTSR